MDWYKRLLEYCGAFGIEPVIENEILLLLCPEEPTLTIQHKIQALLPPDMEFKFIRGPRVTVVNQIDMLIKQAGSTRTAISFNDEGVLLIRSTLEPTDKVWKEVEAVAKTDKFIVRIKKSQVKPDPKLDAFLNKIFDSSSEPLRKPVSNVNPISKLNKEIEMNQEGGHDISKDDLLNLSIELGNANTVEDFLNSLKETK